MMLLVWLLRDTFSGLWNVIGGLGIIPGEWPLRHTVLRHKPSLGVPTSLILCGPRTLTEVQLSPEASYSGLNSVSYHCRFVKDM